MSQLSKKLLELAQKQNDFFKAPLTIEDMSDEENTKSETLNKKRRFEATPTRDVSASEGSELDLSCKLNQSTTKKGHLEHTTEYKNSMYLDNLSHVYAGSAATSSQQSNTSDSGVSYLSQEQLNEKKNKEAYIEYMKKYKDITDYIDLDDLSFIDGNNATTSSQNTTDSGFSCLSQEQLNEEKTKSAYLEFMKKYKVITDINLHDLSPLHSERATTSRQKIDMSDFGSLWLSQEQLNEKKTKEAYLEFMKECKDIDYKDLDDFTLSKREKAKKSEKSTEKQKNLKKNTLKLDKNPNQNREQKKIKKTVIPKNIQHWYKLQDSRNVGLYVLCDTCNKVRYLPDIKDPLDLSEKWYCHMNLNKNYNKCEDPEEEIKDKEYVIDNLFNAGSIVWAKLGTHPWWPAMVDDDPDIEDYFWMEDTTTIPIKYHVTFFNSFDTPKAWLYTKDIKPFKINMSNPTYTPSKHSTCKKRINVDIEEATAAIELPLIERLRKYSFVTRNVKICENQFRECIYPKKREEKTLKTSNLKKQKKNDKTFNKKHSRTSKESDDVADLLKDIDSNMEDACFEFLWNNI